VKFIEQRIDRLQELKQQRPQYQEVFVFYETLFRFLQGERQDFLTVAPDQGNRELRHREGFPLLTGAGILVRKKEAAAFLVRLADVLKEKGLQGQEELARFQQAIAADTLDLPALFRACLDRNRQILGESAAQAEITPALLEYILDTGLSFALQKAREEGLGAQTEGWRQGYCPLCGGFPSMGELTGEEGIRKLHCAACATAWTYPRLRCTACGNTDPDSMEYFTAEGETAHRVDICRKCSSYLKTVDSRQAGKDLPMELEDVATLHLDLLAQREGFTRGKRNS